LVLQLSEMTSQEKQLADLINRERIERGLQPLIIDSDLVKWSKIKSQDMVKNNYFAHEAPDYGKAAEMLRNAGVVFRYVGENLGKASTVTNVHNGFMKSSVHKAAILHKGYSHVGIGIFSKGPTIFVTEIFAAK